MKKISLKLSSSKYDIVVGEGILPKIGSYLADLKLPSNVVVISDSNTSKIYSSIIKHSLRSKGFKSEMLQLPQGEKVKSLDYAKKLYDELLEMKVGRDSTIIALGGGVIGDLSGFLSATYMRGINFIQVPTTLLAQVDASIGGKNGVNVEKAKNIVGTFYHPRLVFCDVSTLITLPAKELRTGLAEVIKYGVIKDASLFGYLERQVLGLKNPKLLDPKDFKNLLSVWENIISRSADIKAKVVMADEKETKGPRMALNFGHTIGHAIENLSKYKGITHGEGVAIGMVAASTIAFKMKMINEKTLNRITALIKAVNLPCKIEGISADDIISKLITDKKVKDGKIVFVLPKSIGSVVMRNDVPMRVLKESLRSIIS